MKTAFVIVVLALSAFAQDQSAIDAALAAERRMSTSMPNRMKSSIQHLGLNRAGLWSM
jgi:hypothetical protein